MDYGILSPVNDWIFKLLFGDERYKDRLIDFLKSFVELPNEEYELTFLDTHLKPEADDDKLGILDVKVRTKSGKIINIEIQVNPIKNIGKRLSFYKSKLIVGQIAESEAYSVIQKVICICITEYKLFPEVGDYLNCFRFYNPKNKIYFDDIPEEIFTLELPKLPVQSDGTNGWNWLQFLRSKTKEEFEMVAAQSPEIRKAVNTLYELSADAKVRAEYEQRLKAFRDRKNEFDGLMDDTLSNVAKKLKSFGTPIEHIAKATGLTIKQIEAI
ncbi:MAG: Rpn family recombination-promoting nuclease/putative transposase [Treponema sp.]|jgi:predicted transposase/invertase (TIGR01784 family)|nr:Rpn family recombination-promoting nuclease/putative transposase [Treponema sp.]